MHFMTLNEMQELVRAQKNVERFFAEERAPPRKLRPDMNILFVVTHDYEFLNRACNCYVRIDKIN